MALDAVREHKRPHEERRIQLFIDIYILQQQHLGAQWVKDTAVHFQLQSFREPKHRHETPSGFVNRRILDARSLGFAIENSVEEVKLLLSVAPADWGAKLVPSTIGPTDELHARVILHERSLAASTASSNQDLQARVPSILEEWRRLTQSRMMRRWRPWDRPGKRRKWLSLRLRMSEAPGTPRTDELFAVAYDVAAAKSNMYDAPLSYAFPPRDPVLSRKPPPESFALPGDCGSRKRWSRDCPHWQQFLLQQKKGGVFGQLRSRGRQGVQRGVLGHGPGL